MGILLPPHDPPLTSVPVPRSPLVGREREAALALALLRRSDVRLLTLTGPGGIGKTRLAVEIASQVDAAFADRVRFVALASVLDDDLVAPTVARATGLLGVGDASVGGAPAVADGGETLLVLDNFEHVVAAAPLVGDLLAASPRLKILVTSRTLLRIDGEYALPVPPLAVPEPEATAIDLLGRAAAVRLFAQRAEAIVPSFAVTADNVTLIADICRRLDGVPLAIELAAARVTHLSLPMLWERLDRRLPLLTGGGRDRPLRLQTMRNAIAWSYHLLPEDEQALFRRLAVFVGGFSLEAAECVADGADVLDRVGALVEANLLLAETGADGAARYRMLGTIREFAGDLLDAGGDAEVARERHAAYHVALAERFDPATLLADGERALAAREADHADLRSALGWLADRGSSAAFLRLASSLGHFWILQGHYREGRGWLERALGGADAAAVDRPRALVALGMIEAYQGDNSEAAAHLAEGLAGCRSQNDPYLAANALLGLGALAVAAGDRDRGRGFLEECLVAARSVPDPRLAEAMVAAGLINLAVIARTDGDPALAIEHLDAALGLQRQAGSTVGMILALGDLGDLARDRGDHPRALALYGEALRLARDNPRRRVAIDVIEAVGVVAAAVGAAERSARLLGAAEALRERIGLRFRVSENQAALDRAVAAGRAALGDRVFAGVWADGRTLSPVQAVAAGLEPFVLPAAGAGASLSPREAEVLRLLAAGLTDPAMAAALFISVRTVENHVARIFAKLGVRTRTAAAAAAIAAGLVDPNPPQA